MLFSKLKKLLTLSNLKKLIYGVLGTLLMGLITVSIELYLGHDDIEPIDVSDLVVVDAPVELEANGFLAISRIRNKFNSDAEQEQLNAVLNGEAYDVEEWQDLLQEYEQEITLYERAIESEDFLSTQLNSMADLIPHLGFLRHWGLVKLAKIKTSQMSDEQKMKAYIGFNNFARLICRRSQSFIELLVGGALQSLVAEQMSLLIEQSTDPKVLKLILDQKYEYAEIQSNLIRVHKKEFFLIYSMAEAVPGGDLTIFEDLIEEGSLYTHPLIFNYVFHKNRTIEIFAEIYREMIKDVSTGISAVDYLNKWNSYIDSYSESVNLSEKRNALGKILPVMYLPAIGTLYQKHVLCQSRFQLLRVKAAMHSYFLQNGAYPATINDLVPNYLEAVPHNQLSNQEMAYTRELGSVSCDPDIQIPMFNRENVTYFYLNRKSRKTEEY
ncbi:hypothetical protein PQO03_11690 [Lentisphaera profundi]|uniref:Uncharacterized protein n=1 Tax=Lentisphaera profundi TaxID=1658616 RepID=A0ABY7VZ06_9BACT|nr:hypothetical protein [Lentisphaera profundi]WDE98504.1 hypothetical protein PQO03_11690 [Lentisphaera profundi]